MNIITIIILVFENGTLFLQHYVQTKPFVLGEKTGHVNIMQN